MNKHSSNLKLCSVIVVNLLTCFRTHAQSSSHRSRNRHEKPVDSYSIFYEDAGLLFPENKKGTFDIRFPYISKNFSTHTVSQNTFHSIKTNLFTSNIMSQGFFCCEYGKKNHFFNYQGGALADYSRSHSGGYYLSMSYGRNFYLGGSNTKLESRKFVIKPSLNLRLYHMSESLGYLDNENTEIDILGCAANPTFQHHTKSTSYTVNSKSLEISYNQTEVCLVPQISITNNPFKNRFFWGLNFSCNIAIDNRGFLAPTQHDEKNYDTNYIGDIGLQTKNLNASFNNNTVTKTPFNFGNFNVSVSVGFRLGVHRKNKS